MEVPKEISGLIIDLFDMYTTAVLYCHEKDAKIYCDKLIKAYDKSKDTYDLSLLEPCYNACKSFLYDPSRQDRSIEALLEDYIND
jgi:hypothetical protein